MGDDSEPVPLRLSGPSGSGCVHDMLDPRRDPETRAWTTPASRSRAPGQPLSKASRDSGVGNPLCKIVIRVLPFFSSSVISSSVSMLDPSGIFIVELMTRRRGRSTTLNTDLSRYGSLPGGPHALFHTPPTRTSHSVSTVQSGSSWYHSF